MSYGHQPEVECFLYWLVSVLHQQLENSSFGIWWLAVMDVLALAWVKRKTLNFRLPSVAEDRLFLRSLLAFEKHQIYRRLYGGVAKVATQPYKRQC